LLFRGAMAKRELYHIVWPLRNRLTVARLSLQVTNQEHDALLPLYTPAQHVKNLRRNLPCSTGTRINLNSRNPFPSSPSCRLIRSRDTAANAKASLLGEKVRQLISMAIAVTTRCDGCITFHTDAALKAGATKQEIAEALGVAMAMNAGAALVYSLHALDSVDAHASKP
jgi:AhpD family alkylhydroperoxidase